jgi:hypothetical protein
MATIAPSTAGSPVVYQSASGGGDQFKAAGNARLHVRNGGGSPITVTVTSYQTCNQNGTHALTQVVPNGSDVLFPVLDPARYSDSLDATGNVHIAYTGVTSVTVAVLA